MQPAFHQSSIEQFAAVIGETAKRRIDDWRRAESFDVHGEILAMMREINLRILLGEDADDLRAVFDNATILRRQRQEFILGKPTTFFRPGQVSAARYERARLDLDQRLLDVVKRRRSSGDSRDVVGMLAMMGRDDNTQMSDDLVVDEIRTLSVSGHETVAEALTWSVVLLCDHPHASANVRDEAIAAASLSPADSVSHLGYTRTVMSEAMRLYPPSWLIVRVAVDDDVMHDGTRIPRGSRIYISPWVIHRLAKYHPDPERFDPARFTPNAIASRPRLTYLPFGAGQRQCIGENLAWLEGVLVLATIYRMVSIARTSSTPVTPEANVTLRPARPVSVRVTAT